MIIGDAKRNNLVGKFTTNNIKINDRQVSITNMGHNFALNSAFLFVEKNITPAMPKQK